MFFEFEVCVMWCVPLRSQTKQPMFWNFVAVLLLFGTFSFYTYVLFQSISDLRHDNSLLLQKFQTLTTLFEDQQQSLDVKLAALATTTPSALRQSLSPALTSPPSAAPTIVRCEQETPHRIAFVMPYIESQTDKLLDAMSNWREYLPFDAANDNVRRACHLVFYYHKSKALHETNFAASKRLILDSLRNATNDASNNFVFDNVHFMYADLSDEDDRYPEGEFPFAPSDPSVRCNLFQSDTLSWCTVHTHTFRSEPHVLQPVHQFDDVQHALVEIQVLLLHGTR